jgi:ABC-2 type transport system ATP-binding protein
MSAAVEAHEVGRRYGPVTAVEDLTFAVELGEILGVLGPNGAGKTTAIRVLTTILAPTWGTFTVGGIPSSRPADIRRRIGVLPESGGYPERQTGEEYLRYHARLFGQSRMGSRAVAEELLGEVGLHEGRRSLIAGYSRGMRQRLGIARALVNRPDVVFLDEPTLGLDPAGQRQMLETVRQLARERGATVLLSTHLLAEVEETCTRVLILNRGRVVADGTVAEITRRAAAPRSARLRVAPDHPERAAALLRAVGGVHGVELPLDRSGLLVVTFDGSGALPINQALIALTRSGLTIVSLELEGARLSDAFLAMTEAA